MTTQQYMNQMGDLSRCVSVQCTPAYGAFNFTVIMADGTTRYRRCESSIDILNGLYLAWRWSTLKAAERQLIRGG